MVSCGFSKTCAFVGPRSCMPDHGGHRSACHPKRRSTCCAAARCDGQELPTPAASPSSACRIACPASNVAPHVVHRMSCLDRRTPRGASRVERRTPQFLPSYSCIAAWEGASIRRDKSPIARRGSRRASCVELRVSHVARRAPRVARRAPGAEHRVARRAPSAA